MSIGDRVKIVNDWITEVIVGRIEKFQTNGKVRFAKVRFPKDVDEKYGNLFPLDELRKV